MLLHTTTRLLPAAAPQNKLPEACTDNEHIDEVSPRRAIPGTGHNHGEGILGRLDIIALGLHAETVGAWRHVREDNFVGSWQHVDIRFAVDAIEIRDVFGILVSQRGELHGKRIVVIAQAEAIRALDGLSVDEEVRQTNHCLPLTLGNILGLKPGDTASTSEDQDAIVGDIRRAVAKLITLQTIIGKVVLEKTCTRIQTAQAMVRTYPEHAVRVALEGRDAIVGKSLLTIVLLEHLALHIVTIEALVGAHPDIAVILAGDTDRLSVVGTVHAKGVDPVLALDIETAKSHRRGYIEALAIGRERHLRDVVIDDTVDLLVVISSLLHHVLLDDIALGIHAEHTILHRGQPQASLLIALDIHYDEVLVIRIVHGVRLLRGRIDPAKALAIRAEPDTPLGIFCDRHHCGRHTFHIVLHYALLGIQAIKPVFIGTDPPPAMTINKGADDAGTAYQVALTELISHIVETVKRDGLLVDTLLKHAEPKVTTGILDDGVDLALREIDLHAVEGVIEQTVVLGLIDGYSLSVVANDNPAEVVAIKRRDGTRLRAFDMYEVIALLLEDTRIRCSDVDNAFRILTETGEDQVAAILQITLYLLSVETDQTFAVSHHPQAPFLIFNHGADGMKVGECASHLAGVRLVAELHHTETRGACQHIAVLTLEETVGITAAFLPPEVSHRHIIEGLAIPGLQRAVHTKIEKAVAILHHGVHIIAGKRLVGFVLTTEHTELITVVTVDTITRRRPDETIVVEVHLSHETTGQLVICIEELTHLCKAAHGQTR